mmetsp:Transcript_8930/g.36876  ORF Transcript_8930/g.36876 Transcript_8930/m.36876 type:complete len:208 (-) Transcript_8930:504-1127(-)
MPCHRPSKHPHSVAKHNALHGKARSGNGYTTIYVDSRLARFALVGVADSEPRLPVVGDAATAVDCLPRGAGFLRPNTSTSAVDWPGWKVYPSTLNALSPSTSVTRFSRMKRHMRPRARLAKTDMTLPSFLNAHETTVTPASASVEGSTAFQYSFEARLMIRGGWSPGRDSSSLMRCLAMRGCQYEYREACEVPAESLTASFVPMQRR